MNNAITTYDSFQLAFEFIQYTHQHVFLTGSAGTGKTFFLQQASGKLIKNFVILAPTGVAAVSAGGQTLHSFFKLPTGVLLTPQLVKNSPLEEISFNKSKIELLNELDTIIIDEVSMLRADVLDAVDFLLKKFRKNPEPFGGVQMIFIGDLFQLPPVVSEQEKETFYYFYELPYFFNSHAFQQISFVAIELENIFRQQNDPLFIEILEHLRKGIVREDHLQVLNSRVDPYFDWFFNKDYIVLTTLNKTVDEINHSRLAQLKGKEWIFEAEIEGNFPENIYPAARELRLKKGARVMFLKNDLSPQKRYFNGKIGTIVDISDEVLSLEIEDWNEPIELEKHTWENIQYYLDYDTKEIKQETVGTFTQFPVKLAWAFTVHKSQGLTFSKIFCDLQRIFSHGQVYVALSRGTSLDGIVLKTPLHSKAIRVEKEVLQFYAQLSSHAPDKINIFTTKQLYWQTLLERFFNDEDIQQQLLGTFMLIPEVNPSLRSWYLLLDDLFFNPFKKNLIPLEAELVHKTISPALPNINQNIYLPLLRFILLLSESFLWLSYFHTCHHDQLMLEKNKWKAFKQTVLNTFKKLYISNKLFKAKTYEEQMLFMLRRFRKEIPLLFSFEPVLTFENEFYVKLRWWRNFHLAEMIEQPYLFVPDKTLWIIANDASFNERNAKNYFSEIQWSFWGKEIMQILSRN